MRFPVNSSNIAEVGYNLDTSELEIVFHYNRKLAYVYKNVHNSIYFELVSAESVGKYFNQHIKPWYEFDKKLL